MSETKSESRVGELITRLRDAEHELGRLEEINRAASEAVQAARETVAEDLELLRSALRPVLGADEVTASLRDLLWCLAWPTKDDPGCMQARERARAALARARGEETP